MNLTEQQIKSICEEVQETILGFLDAYQKRGARADEIMAYFDAAFIVELPL